MKRIPAVVLIIFISIFLFVFFVTAEEPGLVLNFRDEEAITDDIENAETVNDFDYAFEDGEFLMSFKNVSGNNDPYVAISVDIDADTYTWVKFRIKNISDCKVCQFYFITTGTGGVNSANAKTEFQISTNDTDYKDYIINIPDANEATTGTSSLWSGTASMFRMDFFSMSAANGIVAEGPAMYVDYIAFFKTQEDAMAYTEPAVVTPAPTSTITPTPEITPTAEAPVESVRVTPVNTPENTPEKFGNKNTDLLIKIGVPVVIVAAVIVCVVVIVKKKKK
ncbi:MAG: hypothetical protein LBI03_05790 [Clostridiales bacterium]|jgi:hypothetical protein|nr:hypothetical protein [Clostridiales bacterium]